MEKDGKKMEEPIGVPQWLAEVDGRKCLVSPGLRWLQTNGQAQLQQMLVDTTTGEAFWVPVQVQEQKARSRIIAPGNGVTTVKKPVQ